MRTPVIIAAGQGDSDAVAEALLCAPGTFVVQHRFDGHVVRRVITTVQHGVRTTAEAGLELAHGCVACTVRNDLLVLLRRLHHRRDVARIVVHLAPWLEPEPICWAIRHVRVRVGSGHPDGPASRDVDVAGVVVALDTTTWLSRALSDDDLADGRTVAQVEVCQAEFADVLVVAHPEPETMAVLRRLAPRARITAGVVHLELALANLENDARRGESDHPHSPLLAGQPPLDPDGRVTLVEYNTRRPFHPERLHRALDRLLDGVVRARGRLWVANRPEHVMWLESAGGGMRVSTGGKWLAALTPSELAYVDPERRAMADLLWDNNSGDRHTAIAMLVCGADGADLQAALEQALLTDEEMARPAQWSEYPDPFGDWHEEPCDDGDPAYRGPSGGRDEGQA